MAPTERTRLQNILLAQYGKRSPYVVGRPALGDRIHGGTVESFADCGMGDVLAVIRKDDGTTSTTLV